MAKPCTQCNFIPISKDELTKNVLRALTKGSNISTPIPVTFHAPISALTSTFTPALGPSGIYIDVNL